LSKEYQNEKEYKKALEALEETKRITSTIRKIRKEINMDDKKISVLKSMIKVIKQNPSYIE
jgi:hypothetical protein